MIPQQVQMYHKYNDLVREGDYYRIASYRENHEFDCYLVAAKDKKEALVTFVQVIGRPNYHSRCIRLQGLDPKGGDLLMNAGLQVENLWGDAQSKLYHLIAE